jgi:hypothetical protein
MLLPRDQVNAPIRDAPLLRHPDEIVQIIERTPEPAISHHTAQARDREHQHQQHDEDRNRDLDQRKRLPVAPHRRM